MNTPLRTYRPSAAGTQNHRSSATTRVAPFAHLPISSFANSTYNSSLITHNSHHSSDLSIWLSVDPMSGKYPYQSNYVYCSNNPLKVIDPNGEDEYFNEYGCYLGFDNSASNNVRMISQRDWDFFKYDNENELTESINADVGIAVGSLISESDPSVFSDDAILGVYQHYGLESGHFEISEIKNSTECDSKELEGDTYSMGYQKSTGNVYIPVSRNRKMAIYDNFYNIINTFDHEYKHTTDNATDPNVREINADNYQMTTSSWENTTNEFKAIRRYDIKYNQDVFLKRNTK